MNKLDSLCKKIIEAREGFIPLGYYNQAILNAAKMAEIIQIMDLALNKLCALPIAEDALKKVEEILNRQN